MNPMVGPGAYSIN
jgi:hypothetical protein